MWLSHGTKVYNTVHSNIKMNKENIKVNIKTLVTYYNSKKFTVWHEGQKLYSSLGFVHGESLQLR